MDFLLLNTTIFLQFPETSIPRLGAKMVDYGAKMVESEW